MSEFKWRHFEGEIILWAVRWYCRYGISYRDLEQMMGERGVPVDHSTIYRWVQRYAPEIEKRLRWQWRRPQSRSRGVDGFCRNRAILLFFALTAKSVDHSTVHRWASKLLLALEKAFRRSKRAVGWSWRVDER